MKILHITSVPISYYGGMERVIWNLSKRMAKKHKVTILQTNLYLPNIKEGVEIKDGVKIITCKNKYFLGGYGYSSSFKKTLKKIWREYDLIHIHATGRFTSDFSLKFIKNKKPIIFTSYGFYHSKQYMFFKKIHNLLKKGLLKYADLCIALTDSEIREYEKRGVKKDKIKVVPIGIEERIFKIKNLKKLKKEYSPEKTMLLYVGRTHESKGLKHILYAIKDLNILFFIVGFQTEYKTELEKIISELNIKNKVVFIKEPGDKEIESLYSATDIFILFSEWESFGLAAVEAMACGKPVIVSNRGSLPHIVKNEENGLVVEYPNIKKLKSKIELLINNKKLRESLGRGGKEFSKKYSWGWIIKEYENLYSKVIKNEG